MKTKNNLKSLDKFVDEQYGKKGTKKRDKFETGFKEFKLGFLIQQARTELGLTQEQLAEKVGTNKAISQKLRTTLKTSEYQLYRKSLDVD